MTELSPTAQAVVNAIDEVRWDWGNMQEADATIIAAAAIRAAADQLYDSASQDYLWKLAAELENTND